MPRSSQSPSEMPLAPHATPAMENPVSTALVLGGGGSAGNAWLIGLIAGLCEGGLDVTRADLILGTSAGATAAAQVSSGTAPSTLLDDILNAVPPKPRPASSPTSAVRVGSVNEQMERTRKIIADSEDAADMRRRMGAAAIGLAAASDHTLSTQWRATVASRLPARNWPERAIRITAVAASTGELVVFERSGGVDLVDAVAASTSSGPAFSIANRPFIDGGYRSNENADLAAGYERVLVLSPLGGRTRTPLEWGMHLAAQVDQLRAGGSDVETILPDSAALEAFGTTLMDPASRPPSARAGREQGRSLVEELSDFWLSRQ